MQIRKFIGPKIVGAYKFVNLKTLLVENGRDNPQFFLHKTHNISKILIIVLFKHV